MGNFELGQTSIRLRLKRGAGCEAQGGKKEAQKQDETPSNVTVTPQIQNRTDTDTEQNIEKQKSAPRRLSLILPQSCLSWALTKNLFVIGSLSAKRNALQTLKQRSLDC